jgi:hypothetical protein
MCFRKAAGVVRWHRFAACVSLRELSLLQGLAKVQIGTRSGTAVLEWASSHSRFAAKMEFHTSHLGAFYD